MDFLNYKVKRIIVGIISVKLIYAILYQTNRGTLYFLSDLKFSSSNKELI